MITFDDLKAKVSRFANILKEKGVKKGDRVAIYLPMITELAIAMLACARIGAVHSIVFGGFSASALADRLIDGGCSIIVTAGGFFTYHFYCAGNLIMPPPNKGYPYDNVFFVSCRWCMAWF